MVRSLYVCALCAFALLLGCASADPATNNEPAPSAPGEAIGRSTAALGTPVEYSLSTRSPVSDNTQLTVTTVFGSPGVVPSGDEGICWIKSISGSFRAANEYAKILRNGSGYYYATVKSRTIDSVTGVGPAMTIRCRYLTDFMPAGIVGDFASNYKSISADLVGWSTPPRREAVVNTTFNSAWPWAGLDGRLGSTSNALYYASKADRSNAFLYISIDNTCSQTYAAVDCAQMSSAWQTYDTTGTHGTWSYSAVNTASNNTNDVALTASAGYECFLDGVNGQWTSTTSATIYANSNDSKWHLSTNAGTSAGMGARASCFPLSQF